MYEEEYENFYTPRFDSEFYNYHFTMFYDKYSIIKKINTVLSYLDLLSEVGFEDESVNRLISKLKKYFELKLKLARNPKKDNSKSYVDYDKNFIANELRTSFIGNLYSDYVAILIPDKHILRDNIAELTNMVKNNDFSLLDGVSYGNFVKFFGLYVMKKNRLNTILNNERVSFLAESYAKISKTEQQVKKYNTYGRFRLIYDNTIKNKKTLIANYVDSNHFSSCALKGNYQFVDKCILDLYDELNLVSEKCSKIINYVEQRILRLKDITPKNMTSEEKELIYKLGNTTDKEEFDKLYSLLYVMFTEHIYDDKKMKNNLKTKRMLNIIKRRVDAKYNQLIKNYLEMHKSTYSEIKDYVYDVLQKVIDDSTISFEASAISKLWFYDFRKDYRVLNEAINGSGEVPENNVFIPKLDNKNFNRGYSHPLLELSFNPNNIDINELTKNVMQDGELNMDYNTFLYQYMSIDTYIKNSEYIGKNFIANDFHNKDSQDFSNSKLLFSYNGILLIEASGEYEVVSHETVTMAGYDIPESDKLKQNTIDNYKKEILTNIINAAESYRDEYSPLNYAKKLKDWNAYD